MKKLWLTVIMACLLAGMVSAQSTGLETDVLPPSWRGDANTTLQGWSFSTNNNPADLDYLMNPYGSPTAQVFTPDTMFPKQTYWLSDHEGHDGVWRLYGDNYMLLTIPNNPDENLFKEIWLQMTWSASELNRPPLFQTDPGYASINLIQSAAVDATYYHSVYKIIIEPNPTSEMIAIQPRDCTLYIDEIVVDTRCVPEPTSVALISVGGIVGLFIRRRLQRGEGANDYLIAPRTHMRR